MRSHFHGPSSAAAMRALSTDACTDAAGRPYGVLPLCNRSPSWKTYGNFHTLPVTSPSIERNQHRLECISSQHHLRGLVTIVVVSNTVTQRCSEPSHKLQPRAAAYVSLGSVHGHLLRLRDRRGELRHRADHRIPHRLGLRQSLYRLQCVARVINYNNMELRR